MIRSVELHDAPFICDIYNHYVKNTIITFEEVPVTVQEMTDRIRKITEKYPYIVYEEEGVVLGYAYAGMWKSRSAYRFTLESTVYVDHQSKGKGMGKQLYLDLLKQLKSGDTHSVMGVIALPNDASVGLHEALGFKKVAQMNEVGYKFGQWLDIGNWQLIL